MENFVFCCENSVFFYQYILYTVYNVYEWKKVNNANVKEVDRHVIYWPSWNSIYDRMRASLSYLLLC